MEVAQKKRDSPHQIDVANLQSALSLCYFLIISYVICLTKFDRSEAVDDLVNVPDCDVKALGDLFRHHVAAFDENDYFLVSALVIGPHAIFKNAKQIAMGAVSA